MIHPTGACRQVHDTGFAECRNANMEPLLLEISQEQNSSSFQAGCTSGRVSSRLPTMVLPSHSPWRFFRAFCTELYSVVTHIRLRKCNTRASRSRSEVWCRRTRSRLRELHSGHTLCPTCAKRDYLVSVSVHHRVLAFA